MKKTSTKIFAVIFMILVTVLMNAPNIFAEIPSSVIEEAKKSMVSIKVDNGLGFGMSFGSGFIAVKEGNRYYVWTNKHVTDSAVQVVATLEGKRRPFILTFFGEAPKGDRDISIWFFETQEDIPIARLGNSDYVKTGNETAAIGCPVGYNFLVTKGIVSKKEEYMHSPHGGSMGNSSFIMIDARVNPGNSGGPLISKDGEVVGINSILIRNTGLGMAIPINDAKRIFEDIKKYGEVKRGKMGILIADPLVITGMPLDDVYTGLLKQKIDFIKSQKCPEAGKHSATGKYAPYGIDPGAEFKGFLKRIPDSVKDYVINLDPEETDGIINGIMADSVSLHSRLKPYDVILEVNGMGVRTMADYSLAVRFSYDNMTFRVLRITGPDSSEEVSLLVEFIEGVEVAKVLERSPFKDKLQVGDIITAFNGARLTSPNGLLRRVVSMYPGDVARLEIFREGNEFKVEATLAGKATFEERKGEEVCPYPKPKH